MHVNTRRYLSLRPVWALLPALFALGLAGSAAAQIDLPERGGTEGETAKPKPKPLKKPQRGDLAPHLTCTVCYERNYTTKVDYQAEHGMQKAWCGVCRQVRLHRIPAGGQSGAGLDLPTGQPIGEPLRPASPTPTPSEGSVSPAVAISAAASVIFAELKRDLAIDDPHVLDAADRLLAHGAEGVAAARGALASPDSGILIVAVRVLLRGGEPDDADAVVRRLRARLPGRAAAAAVNELVARDPVRATPVLMSELLMHSQQPVRNAAERFLARHATPDLVPLLIPALNGKSGDARFKAVGLLEQINDPSAVDLLLERLDDRRAKVAWRAVDAIAGVDDPRVEVELMRRAFGERWILRPAAYALLGLVEREDRTLVNLLQNSHVSALLGGLDSSDPFIAGTCAAALAGIGFRTASPADTPWLDRRVPERLVSIVAGFDYFDDYTSLREPALRRLKQIAGVSFGSDGPRWAEWWLQTADTFHPSRAVLEVAEGDERKLQVAYRSSMADSSGAVVLLAPDAAAATTEASAAGEILYISAAQARDFAQLMRSEGLFGLERLPGVRGGQPDRGRALEVRIGDRAKSFVFGVGATEPWFERVASMAEALRDRNRWQRYPHPETHGSRLGLFMADGAWWDGDHDVRDRALRLKALVLDFVAAQPIDDRDAGLAELTRLYEEGANEPADFERLVALLEDEPYFVGRAGVLAKLARIAADLSGEPLADDAERPEAEVSARADQLVATLLDGFGPSAAPVVADILLATGAEAVRIAGHDERPLMRAIAATVLADRGTKPDIEVLLRLLEDPDENVEIAAVAACGHDRVEEARTELLLRARYGTPLVRTAALRAAGELGGEGVRETLIANLTDPDSRFRVPAADGLASLEDPKTAALLVSLLRGGERGELYEPARRGLIGLGEGAYEELYTAVRSPSPVLRREAGLILAYQAVPDSANALIRVLAEDPTDTHVAAELVILTCVDLRDETDAAEAWYRWWDGVVRDDSNAWFRAACEARGFSTPPAEAFADGGNEEAIAFLLAVMRRPEPFLVERARRGLSLLVHRDLGAVPAAERDRDAWLTTLYEVLTKTQAR
ncbi:MAG: HEAT repeat domain-containing protein [bacterium]|nr:HEAT repeat domain-containing protein [bacterium]